MGTRSRLNIRTKKRTISFHFQFDGYLTGVGNDLAKVIHRLLRKHTVRELRIIVDNLEEGKERIEEPKNLYKLFSGEKQYQFDAGRIRWSG